MRQGAPGTANSESDSDTVWADQRSVSIISSDLAPDPSFPQSPSHRSPPEFLAVTTALRILRCPRLRLLLHLVHLTSGRYLSRPWRNTGKRRRQTLSHTLLQHSYNLAILPVTFLRFFMTKSKNLKSLGLKMRNYRVG